MEIKWKTKRNTSEINICYHFLISDSVSFRPITLTENEMQRKTDRCYSSDGTAVHRFRNWHSVEQRIAQPVVYRIRNVTELVLSMLVSEQRMFRHGRVRNSLTVKQIRLTTVRIDEKGGWKKTTAWICFKWRATLTTASNRFMNDRHMPGFHLILNILEETWSNLNFYSTRYG